MNAKLTVALLVFFAPRLAGADLLDIYENLTEKTILRSSVLASLPDAMIPGLPTEKSNAIARIESELSQRGIAVVEDGEQFVQAVPFAQRGLVIARAPKPGPVVERLEPKAVPSLNHDFNQDPSAPPKSSPDRPAERLLEFYASLANKTTVPAAGFDKIPLWFHVETPLSKSELRYAIETTFALNRLTIIPVGGQGIRLGQDARPSASTGKPTPR